MLGLDPAMLTLIAFAMVMGGLVKGVTGIGLPIVCVAILSQFLEVPLVLALVTIPICLTNFWQAVLAGSPLGPIRRFWLMILCLLVSLWLSAKLVVRFEPEALYGLIGSAVVIFTTSSFIRPGRGLSPSAERWAGPLAGLLGGFLGGVSAMWGPPMMMYFVMLRLSKEDFIRSVGLVWFAASLPLVAGYVDNGILTARTAQLSALACVPAFAGLWLGQWLRRFIDQETFRRVLLLVLFLIGLNLFRRALF